MKIRMKSGLMPKDIGHVQLVDTRICHGLAGSSQGRRQPRPKAAYA